MLALGRTIRSLRTQQGLSQKELAERADITPSFLSLVENDQRDASIKVTLRIAEALEVPVEVLIWDAVDIPFEVSSRDRHMCELAKSIVRGAYENASRTTRRSL
ncbi:MAG: helix-turn-helix transcriptional regulator [Phycisphaerales bacterium]